MEFYGDGVSAVPLANRATIGNMSPEYGSTVAIFPIDDETLRYLELTGRTAEQVALVEAYTKAQGLWHDPSHEPAIEIDVLRIKRRMRIERQPQTPPQRTHDLLLVIPHLGRVVSLHFDHQQHFRFARDHLRIAGIGITRQCEQAAV